MKNALTFERLRSGPHVDAVGGMAVGAVPYVSAVLAAAAEADPETPLLGFFVRKEAKKHGKGRQIEGGFAPGQTVALVEDTTTTGGSTLEALDLVETGAASAQRFPVRVHSHAEASGESDAADRDRLLQRNNPGTVGINGRGDKNHVGHDCFATRIF